LRYFVQNAGWSPVYSLRAQNITDPVKLDYDAVVRQKTGEDWNDVKLMLATINPNLSGNKPELSPWYLSIYVPRPIYKNRLKFGRTKEVTDAAPMYQQSMQKDERRLDDKDSQTMSTIADYTTTTQGQLNTTFDIAIKYSIPSDDNGQQVRVQQYNLPAVYEYISIPKFDKDAFLLAKVGGWEQFNLIPGPANLFFDGTYVGKSDINPVITGDTLALSFGRDKKISIDRIKIKELAKKQLLGGTKTETYSYDIVVKNVKNVPVRITIEDQIPLVTDKDIKVEALELSHGFLDEETGKVLWRGVLKPNEVYKMRLTYSVKYPKGKIIMGLN
ncbi:MAG: DUF4139 domain-containing protein, partial [Bacteroidetes bacterium]|nr:DUF4139 domain-containing protein [Bacteroidota bacterium]